MNSSYNATLTWRSDLTPTTMAIRVKLDQGPLNFSAGQYAILGLERAAARLTGTPTESQQLNTSSEADLIRRAYSITSKSSAVELEFVITLVPHGSLTPRLFALKAGDRLFVENKAHGAFTTARSSGNRDLLLCATGPAIAPYISMIRDQFPVPEHCYVLVHGAGAPEELFYRPQLEELAANSPRLIYLPTLLDKNSVPAKWKGLQGSIEEIIGDGSLEEQIGMPIAPERFDVFLSGNPSMIEKVTSQLVNRGFVVGPPTDAQTNIFGERYW